MFTIIAGSNGCGKSTVSASSRNEFQVTPILDPDAVARSLQTTANASLSNIEAGKQVLELAEALLAASESFTVETTLSGGTYLRMAERAKALGYTIFAVFVGTDSVEINIERVKARVRKGGHDIPEADQRRRYPRTLANMRRLLPLCDLVVLLDNSTERGPKLVAFGQKHSMHWNEPVPVWAEQLQADRPGTDDFEG